MDAPSKPPTVLSDTTVARALQILFGGTVTRPDQMPRLPIVERTNKGAKKTGEKPLEARIEYQLLVEGRDAANQLTLERMMDRYRSLTYNAHFRHRDRAWLDGARLIAVLGYAAEVPPPTRAEVKRFIINVEHELLQERECGGQFSVLGNSYRPEIEAVNSWLKGYAVTPTQRKL